MSTEKIAFSVGVKQRNKVAITINQACLLSMLGMMESRHRKCIISLAGLNPFSGIRNSGKRKPQCIHLFSIASLAWHFYSFGILAVFMERLYHETHSVLLFSSFN